MNPAYPPPIVVHGIGDAAEVVRAYKIWKGSNIFGLQGRLIFGPDASSILLTLPMIVVPVAVFCAFVGRKFIDDFPRHLGILIIIFAVLLAAAVLAFLVLTSARDPGIIPRSTHPPPEAESSNSFHESETEHTRYNNSNRRVKEMIINGMRVQVKYCESCMLYRPPRCSHCSICDNCVERFDHHCPWVGQCIGLRNYRFYFLFISSATLLCIYVFAFCSVHVSRIMDGEGISVWKALAKSPASIVLMAYSFFSVWFVGGLTVFHSYLISKNQTTYENFRYRYEARANPYNRGGVMGNWKEVFFSGIPPSKNNFRAKVVVRVPDFPSRRVLGDASFMNPSFMGKREEDGIIEMGMKLPSSVFGDESGREELDRESVVDDNNGSSIQKMRMRRRRMVDEVEEELVLERKEESEHEDAADDDEALDVELHSPLAVAVQRGP